MGWITACDVNLNITMFAANAVVTQLAELLPDYYPGDAPEEALRMGFSYIHENEISGSTFQETFRRMGGKLSTFIIEQRFKHPKIPEEFLTFVILKICTKELLSMDAMEIRILHIVPTHKLITVITLNISISEMGTSQKVRYTSAPTERNGKLFCP